MSAKKTIEEIKNGSFRKELSEIERDLRKVNKEITQHKSDLKTKDIDKAIDQIDDFENNHGTFEKMQKNSGKISEKRKEAPKPQTPAQKQSQSQKQGQKRGMKIGGSKRSKLKPDNPSDEI